jgi:hypothetical protein
MPQNPLYILHHRLKRHPIAAMHQTPHILDVNPEREGVVPSPRSCKSSVLIRQTRKNLDGKWDIKIGEGRITGYVGVYTLPMLHLPTHRHQQLESSGVFSSSVLQ